MDIVGLAEIVSAAAVLIGFGFAVSELRRYRSHRARESALALVGSFQTPEFAQALMLMIDLPQDLSKKELEERLGPEMKLVWLLMTTWESLGVLLYRGVVDIRMVDDFFSGPIVMSWLKLEDFVLEARSKDQRDTYFEWFQWLAERMLEREDRTRRVPAHVQYKNWQEKRSVVRKQR